MEFLNAVWNYGVIAILMCFVISGAVFLGAKFRIAKEKKDETK